MEAQASPESPASIEPSPPLGPGDLPDPKPIPAARPPSDDYTDFERIMAECGDSMPAGVLEVKAARGNPNFGPHLHKGFRDQQEYFKGEKSNINQPLFNKGDYVPLKVKREKYKHRLVAILASKGTSYKEIAATVGYSEEYLHQLIQLPWVQDCIQSMQEGFHETVQSVLVETSLDAACLLKEVVNNTKASNRDRVTAAKIALDRVFGSAPQTIIHKQDVDVDKLSDEELAQIVTKGREN